MTEKLLEERLQRLFYCSSQDATYEGVHLPTRQEVHAMAVELQFTRKALGKIAGAMEDVRALAHKVYEP